MPKIMAGAEHFEILNTLHIIKSNPKDKYDIRLKFISSSVRSINGNIAGNTVYIKRLILSEITVKQDAE